MSSNNQYDSISSNTSDYQLLDCIGEGNFGKVFKALYLPLHNNMYSSKDTDFVAVKVINLDDTDEDVETYCQEMFFLASLKNYNKIVKYYKTFMYSGGGGSLPIMWIVMEYCGGGSCLDLIKSLPPHDPFLNESQISFITKEILQSLQYLWREGKLHRDIKLANILLTSSGDVKLSDFGVSGKMSLLNSTKLKSFVGTPYWMAPEVIKCGYSQDGEEEDNNNNECLGYDSKADVWSLGITVLEMFDKRAPLSNKDPMKILSTITRRQPPRLTDCKNNNTKVSSHFKDFIEKCLQLDPKDRLSIDQLLRHKFITRYHNMNTNGILKRQMAYLSTYQLNKRNKNRQNLRVVLKTTPNAPSCPITPSITDTNWDFEITQHNINSAKSFRLNTHQTSSPMSNIESIVLPTAQTTPELSPQEQGKMQLEQKIAERLNNLNSFKEVIYPVFNNILNRATEQETKKAVATLLNELYNMEVGQNGFTAVFIEEVCMKLHDLGIHNN